MTSFAEHLQAARVERRGKRGLVELVTLVGYYCLVSLTLNAFELGLPEGRAAELGEAPARPAGAS